MAGSSQNGEGLIGAINVTPLVDIMLVLLVLTLVAIKLDERPENELPLSLPHSTTAQTKTRPCILTLTKDGKLFVDGAPTNSAELPSVLAGRLAENPALAVRLEADADVRNQQLVSTLDVLRHAKVEDVSLGVAP